MRKLSNSTFLKKYFTSTWPAFSDAMSQSSLTVCVYDSSCLRSVLDWTIVSLDDERTSVDGFLYNVALPLCEPGVQQHLAERKHCIEEAKVGKSSASLMRIGNTGWSTLMNAVAVTCYCTCASAIFSFYKYIIDFIYMYNVTIYTCLCVLMQE